MHTTGEPTRIVYSGFPELHGTLLEQRALTRSHYDYIRRSLIYEPRGHRDMYGAILRPHTELVDAGQAHMGVLFLTHEGYSTMCGHATIAISRLLVDCTDTALFPRRDELLFDEEKKEVEVRLHVPCGLVRATVPAIKSSDSGNWCADTTRTIHYLSVPSFAAGIGLSVPIPPSLRWPNLGDRENVIVDVAYGGAFYIVLPASALGFSPSLAHPDIAALSDATKKLRAAFNASAELRSYLRHPDHEDLQFLYSVFVTEPGRGVPAPESAGAETGLCFFADQQVDRSPTGSGVQARVALAVEKGERKLGQCWTYHSIVSNAYGGKGGFTGTPVEETEIGGRRGVRVRVSGWANYTGFGTFVVEEGDEVGGGFSLEQLQQFSPV
ncbi:hypothetical protein H2201_008899 [Coniosporium apollinis]|uniref:trans-L-3-hydroxyproline dehydratase n=1 Tax=Coniosporium apollinis TaxID=61459 RepID=A0ABQ9NF51_9PEZI|nr:hypothetical protein H2201_008899 [Coniosporium apollinis]